LHNLNYWQFGDYLGIGAGAHGKITTAKGEVIRTQRTRLPKDYLSSVANQRAASATEIKPEHLSGEFMLNALRLKSGVDTQLFEARTGVSMAQLMPTVNKLVGDSLLAPNPAQRLKATDHGFRFLNNVLAAFLPEEN
jgi:oxygen-independent coproporphyrinogen-3 oxidase